MNFIKAVFQLSLPILILAFTALAIIMRDRLSGMRWTRHNVETMSKEIRI